MTAPSCQHRASPTDPPPAHRASPRTHRAPRSARPELRKGGHPPPTPYSPSRSPAAAGQRHRASCGRSWEPRAAALPVGHSAAKFAKKNKCLLSKEQERRGGGNMEQGDRSGKTKQKSTQNQTNKNHQQQQKKQPAHTHSREFPSTAVEGAAGVCLCQTRLMALGVLAMTAAPSWARGCPEILPQGGFGKARLAGNGVVHQ